MTDVFSETRGNPAAPRSNEPRTMLPRPGRSTGSSHPHDDHARAARLSSIVKFAGHLATLPTEDAIIPALLQAAAVWYDLDARAYHRETDGSFLLQMTLPGVNRSDSPIRLAAGLSKPTRVSSLVELNQLGWRNPSASVLLLPIVVGCEARWIVSVTGSTENDVEAELGSLCTILGTLFERLALKRADALYARLADSLGRRSASPPEMASALLTDLARTVSAVQAGLWLGTDGGKTVQLASVGATPLQPPVFGDLQPALNPDRILLPVLNGESVAGALELRAAPDAPFTAEHGSLAIAGIGSLQVWLAGLRAGGVLERSGTLTGSAFEIRLREEIERAKRFGLPVGLLVFASPGTGSAQQAPDVVDALVRELRNQLRACDVVGSLDQGDLAVLFTHTDASGLSAALGRISERLGVISRRSEFPVLRVGQAVYPSHAESASELLTQARLAARQPAGSIM